MKKKKKNFYTYVELVEKSFFVRRKGWTPTNENHQHDGNAQHCSQQHHFSPKTKYKPDHYYLFFFFNFNYQDYYFSAVVQHLQVIIFPYRCLIIIIYKFWKGVQFNDIERQFIIPYIIKLNTKYIGKIG